MDKEKVSFYLDKGQIERLRTLTGVTRVNISVYIREGIDMVLAKYQKELKKAPKKKGGE